MTLVPDLGPAAEGKALPWWEGGFRGWENLFQANYRPVSGGMRTREPVGRGGGWAGASISVVGRHEGHGVLFTV